MTRVRPHPSHPSHARQAESDRPRRGKQSHRLQRPDQIPIALDSTAAEAPRDFVPWRFSDAGNRRAQPSAPCQASEKPAQEPTADNALTAR